MTWVYTVNWTVHLYVISVYISINPNHHAPPHKHTCMRIEWNEEQTMLTSYYNTNPRATLSPFPHHYITQEIFLQWQLQFDTDISGSGFDVFRYKGFKEEKSWCCKWWLFDSPTKPTPSTVQSVSIPVPQSLMGQCHFLEPVIWTQIWGLLGL